MGNKLELRRYRSRTTMSTSHYAPTVSMLREMALSLGSRITDDQAMALIDVAKRKYLRMDTSLDWIERELTVRSSDPEGFNRTLARLKMGKSNVLKPFLQLLLLLRTSKDETTLREGFGASVCSFHTSGWMRAWYHQEIKCETRRHVSYGVERLDAQKQHEEKKFLSDFSNSLLGVYGGMITRDCNDSVYLTDRVSDELKPIAINFLPLVDGHNTLSEFVTACSELTQGRVNQALAAFIEDNVLRKFYSSIETVESSCNNSYHQFCMRDILLELRESAREFEVALKMIERVRGKKGGACLSALHEFATKETDPLYKEAIRTASRPFFDSLCTYLYWGLVDDAFKEFMIAFKPNASLDKLFTIVADQVPSFLEAYAQCILKTGKYVYIIQKSYEEKGNLPEKDITWFRYSDPYEGMIKNAYAQAEQCLIDIILREYDLLGLLKTIVALCSENLGDFFMCIIENMAAHVLFKPVDPSNQFLMVSDINRCLMLCRMGTLPHHGLLKIRFKRRSLEDQILKGTNDYKYDFKAEITALEALTFLIEIPGPVNIILDDLAIERYQILFRHAIQIRLIYYKLTKVHSLFNKLTTEQCFLKHCMLSFISSLSTYTIVDVIQSHWIQLSDIIEKVQVTSVDELREAHETFQHNCLAACMINPPSVYASLKTLLDVCSQFSESVDVYFDEVFFAELVHLLRSISGNHIFHPFIATVKHTFAFNSLIARSGLEVPSVFSLSESTTSSYTSS